jgi:hypothetical protein
MERGLRWRLRWAAAYLADRYYLNECKETYNLEGYDILDPYKSFSVDLALGFIALSRVRSTDALKEICRALLFTTLEFVDDEMVEGKNADDVDITVPWMLYEHYNKIHRAGVNDPWLRQFAIVAFPFIFSNERIYRNASSYELGRGIVETTLQLSPVVKRFGRIFDVDMG